MLFNENAENSQLINVGFQPQRFSFLVKSIRKILWLFIRPFHFHQAKRQEQLDNKIDRVKHEAEIWHKQNFALIQKQKENIQRAHTLLSMHGNHLVNIDAKIREIDSHKQGLSYFSIVKSDIQSLMCRIFDLERQQNSVSQFQDRIINLEINSAQETQRFQDFVTENQKQFENLNAILDSYQDQLPLNQVDYSQIIDEKINNRFHQLEQAIQESKNLFHKKSFSQAGEDIIVKYIFDSIGLASSDVYYLDLGAALPTGDNNSYLFYTQGARGVLVEADPDYLIQYQNSRPGDVALSGAVLPSSMAAKKTISFYISENKGWSSVLKEHVEKGREKGKGDISKIIEVETLILNNILEKYFSNKPFHLLSMDVEGLDQELIADIDFNRYQPWVIIIEVMHDKEKRIDHYLQSNGYVLYASTCINSIYISHKTFKKLDQCM